MSQITFMPKLSKNMLSFFIKKNESKTNVVCCGICWLSTGLYEKPKITTSSFRWDQHCGLTDKLVKPLWAEKYTLSILFTTKVVACNVYWIWTSRYYWYNRFKMVVEGVVWERLCVASYCTEPGNLVSTPWNRK